MQQRQSRPPSTTLERPLSIWEGRQDEFAGVEESDKVFMDGGHAGGDDDGHLRSPRQVNHYPVQIPLLWDTLRHQNETGGWGWGVFWSYSLQKLLQNCETQRSPVQKLSSSIFPCCSFVHPSVPSRLGNISTYLHCMTF